MFVQIRMNAWCHNFLFINFLNQSHVSVAKSKDIKGGKRVTFI